MQVLLTMVISNALIISYILLDLIAAQSHIENTPAVLEMCEIEKSRLFQSELDKHVMDKKCVFFKLLEKRCKFCRLVTFSLLKCFAKLAPSSI